MYGIEWTYSLLLVHEIHNFQNIPKTLIRISQCVQSAKWGAGDVEIRNIRSEGGKLVSIDEIQSRCKLQELGFGNDKVFMTNAVKINGILFKKNFYVCLDVKGDPNINLPIFGKISEIIFVDKNTVYFLTSIYNTLHFDTDLNAYAVQIDKNENSTCFVES